jgi:Putative type VII ESX secretion system translocon, EccE
MARLGLRWPRRATVVFVEAVLAVAAAAVAVQSIAGYVVAGVAVVIGIAFLVRRRGRGLREVLRDRLRDPAPAPGVDPPPAPDPTRPDVGLIAGFIPGLHIADVPGRDGRGLGVIGDGQGFAVLLAADIGAVRNWPFADLMTILTADPARPAAVQLLIEQRGPRRAGLDPDFGPSRTYRSLPVRGLPLWSRVLVVIRHEPAWAPETVTARGGGATGARNALAAIASRTVAAAARDGIRLRPIGVDEVAVLLREVGDPAPNGEVGATVLSTATSAHTTLSVALTDEATIGAVLRASAELDVERSVLSVTANAIDHSVCAAVRLVAADPARLEEATATLTADGLATSLRNAQDAGLVATLPLGGGARSLADLVNQGRM